MIRNRIHITESEEITKFPTRLNLIYRCQNMSYHLFQQLLVGR